MIPSIIIGYSGHAFVVLDVLKSKGIVVVGYCEQKMKDVNPFNLEYLGSEWSGHVVDTMKGKDAYIGIGKGTIREKIFRHLDAFSIRMPVAAARSAVVSDYAIVDKASVIMPGVFINALARIGTGVICNTASVIEHECNIGNFAHIAPGAVLAGNVTVGDNSFIGANTVVKEGVTIGNNVIIGAGSVIVKNVPDNMVVVGNPQRNLYAE